MRRLRWQARAPNAADAFALQQLLHRRSDDVGMALEQAFSGIGLGDEVWHLPSLTLRLDASSLAEMDADLPSVVASALRQALQAALPADAARRTDPTPALESVNGPVPISTLTSRAESAQAALRHYLATGGLPWALAGLGAGAQQQALQGAAQVALEAVLARQGHAVAVLDECLGTAAPLSARIGALLRWLPLLSPAQRQRWLAHSPRPAGLAPALAEAWVALLTSPGAALEWAALWLLWPTLSSLRALAATGNTPVGSPDGLALARWIAELPAEIAALRLPSPVASATHLAAALLHALGSPPARIVTMPSPTDHPRVALARPITTAPDTQLVPLAGLVLLHPYLPRLLKGCGLVEDTTGRRIADADLPRACALLHALACGEAEATEHQLPLIKLLLSRPPDQALTAAIPRLNAADREEVDNLLAAVRSHWKALGNTSVDGLRLSFLQRRGLLRRADGAWQLHMQAEAFDLLLKLLPWSIGLVKLPWMPLPLMVEWHAP